MHRSPFHMQNCMEYCMEVLVTCNNAWKSLSHVILHGSPCHLKQCMEYLLCGGRKKSPRTSSIVQIIFYFGPLRSVKIFRVFKTLTFRNILLSIFLIIDPI